MTEAGPREDDSWPCGWEEHEREQLRRLARLPFRLKLQWLEEAHRLVLHLTRQRAREQSGPPPTGPA